MNLSIWHDVIDTEWIENYLIMMTTSSELICEVLKHVAMTLQLLAVSYTSQHLHRTYLFLHLSGAIHRGYVDVN